MKTKANELSEYVIDLQNGNVEAFEKIYNLSYQQAYFTAFKICKNETDAQDILQESYIYLLEKFNDIKNPAAFMNWFNMVVANKSRNLLRKNNPLLFNNDQEEYNIACSVEDEDYCPVKRAEQNDFFDGIMKQIENLSAEKRTVVILFYFNEMTTKQIAQSLCINENTVKSRLFQAKKDLKKWLDE